MSESNTFDYKETSHSEGDESDTSQSDSEEGSDGSSTEENESSVLEDSEEESDDSSSEENKNNVLEFLVQDVLYQNIDKLQKIIDDYRNNGSSEKDSVTGALIMLRPHYQRDFTKKFVNYINTMMTMH